MLIVNLRNRLSEYRYFKLVDKSETSIHVNALEIALNLAEFAIEKGREIKKSELIWFEADWELINIFENSEWEDLLNGYFEIKEFLKDKKLI